jgi:hypothetical protein
LIKCVECGDALDTELEVVVMKQCTVTYKGEPKGVESLSPSEQSPVRQQCFVLGTITFRWIR